MNDTDRHALAITLVCLFVIVAFVVGFRAGQAAATAAERAAAVKAGAARYDADPHTGEVRFAYK